MCHCVCPHHQVAAHRVAAHRVAALHSPLQSLPHHPLQVPPSLASCPLPAWHSQDALAVAHCAWMGQVGLDGPATKSSVASYCWVDSCVMNAGVL